MGDPTWRLLDTNRQTDKQSIQKKEEGLGISKYYINIRVIISQVFRFVSIKIILKLFSCFNYIWNDFPELKFKLMD